MKKTLSLVSIVGAAIGFQISSALAVPSCVAPTPGPLDSETGIAGVAMAGVAAYLVWRRRKA